MSDDGRPGRLDEAGREAVEALIPVAYRYLASYRRAYPGLADDLESDALLGVCRAVLTHDPGRGRSLSSWAHRCVRGHLRNAVRDHRAWRARLRRSAALERSGPDDLRRAIAALDAEALVGRLPGEMAELVRLLYRDGVSTDEAARRTGLAHRTCVRRRHLRALALMRA